MTDLLWQKPGVRVDERIQRFCAGDDVLLDREFLGYDIAASKVHAEGLQRIGILTPDEHAGISRELDALDADFAAGRFVLDERFEDGHSAIEARLSSAWATPAAASTPAAAATTRCWSRPGCGSRTGSNACRPRAAIARRSRSTAPPPKPTCRCRATPTCSARWCPRLGMWWAGWAEAFIDDAVRAGDTRAWIDANPLGSAAGYGVNLPLDRDHATAALGFGRLQLAPTYAQLSRGKFELAAVDALGSAVLDLRRLAWDLSLFTSAEYGFVALPAEYTTGSSIMPNKRNPDVVELMRASYASVAAARTEIEQLLSLPSGYHRDLQRARARSSTPSAAAWARWNCCRTCCATWNGSPTRCAPRWNRRCTPPIWRWTLPARASRSATHTARPPIRRAGRRVIRRKASRPGFRPARPATSGSTPCAAAWNHCNTRNEGFARSCSPRTRVSRPRAQGVPLRTRGSEMSRGAGNEKTGPRGRFRAPQGARIGRGDRI
jgi:argininosuccinate lyase